jgi:hypothetical protein
MLEEVQMPPGLLLGVVDRAGRLVPFRAREPLASGKPQEEIQPPTLGIELNPLYHPRLPQTRSRLKQPDVLHVPPSSWFRSRPPERYRSPTTSGYHPPLPTRNSEEPYFAEVEPSGFSPDNLVPGIGLSPDRMLMERIFSYHDTHLHRIGANYERLPITSPRTEGHPYYQDAPMAYRHSGAQPVYAPNPYGCPVADPARGSDLGWAVAAGGLGRCAQRRHSDDDDFVQARALYRDVMNDTERSNLVSNIVAGATQEVGTAVWRRVAEYWKAVHLELGQHRQGDPAARLTRSVPI